MIPELEISRLAMAELDLARAWYENQRRGLGEEFLDEVERHVATIRESPLRFPVHHHAVRRCVVRRFPFQIFFDLRPTKIRILRVVHSSRDPGPIQELLP